MLPDQVANLFNIQFFITVIMWLTLLIALIRREQPTSRRAIAIVAWLVATMVICPITSSRLNGLYDKLVYDGIQHALDDHCGQGYAQAETGTYTQMSSYHWRWNGLRRNNFVICDYERGYTSWNCSC